MTILDKPSNATKESTPLRSWIRAAIGLGTLSAVTFWVLREGSLLQQMNAWALLWSTLIVLLINFVSAALLRVTARMYQRDLSYRLALYIGALGSLGNATGGLPIGTTLKYAILRQRVGLTIGQITFGLVSVTVAISLSLSAVAAISVIGLEFTPGMKIVPAALFACGTGATLIFLWWSRTHNALPSLLKPLFAEAHMAKLALFSLLLAMLFVINYMVVGLFVLPERSVPAVAFISASAMLLSIASFLQSVGGIQEIVMGFTAFLTGAQIIEGVQLALIIRLAAIISSGLTLAWFFITPGQPDPGAANASERGGPAR